MNNFCLYTYAFDGSGVALRCGVEVQPLNGGMVDDAGQNLVLVKFTDYVPTIDRMGERPCPVFGVKYRYVNPKSFTVEGSNSPLASFNWLD